MTWIRRFCSALQLSALFTLVACTPFEKEIKQDYKIKYYKSFLSILGDSIQNVDKRIGIYSNLLDTIDNDKDIYTISKQNDLKANIYNFISAEYLSIKKMDSAWTYINKAIDADSTNYTLWYNKGCIAQESGKDSIALFFYQKYLTKDSLSANAYYNRALVFYNQKQYEKAISENEKALKCSNLESLAHAHNNIGSAYFQLQDYPNALKAYQKALDSDSTLSEVVINLGDTYLKLNRTEEAKYLFLKALKFQDKNQAAIAQKKLKRIDTKETDDEI